MIVQKDLSPEIKAMVGNIMSLCQQIQSQDEAPGASGSPELSDNDILAAYAAMKAAEGGRQENAPEGQAKPVAGETEEDKANKLLKGLSPAARKALKAIIASDPDASTASDTAEERIKDQPKDNSDLSEIQKVLHKAAAALEAKTVKKSQDDLEGALGAIAKSLTAIAENQNKQGIVIHELLEGLGVAKAFAPTPDVGVDNKNSVVNKSAPSASYNGAGDQISDVLKSIVEGIAKQNQSGNTDRNFDRGAAVRKDLGDVAQILFGKPANAQ